MSRADDLQAAHNDGQFFGEDEALLIAAIPDLLAVVRAAQALATELDVDGDVSAVTRDAMFAALAAFEAGEA